MNQKPPALTTVALIAALLMSALGSTSAEAKGTPIAGPAPGMHLHTGALFLIPPGDAPETRVWVSMAFQLGSTETRGWGETTSSRGGLAIGGEWVIPRTHGLVVGGSLAALELLSDHVDVPPAIDEHETRLDLGATRLYFRYLIGDSKTERGRWLPKSSRLQSQLSAYLRVTLPTATSVLSRARHPRPPLRDALGDGINDMNWGAVELGASFGLVVAHWVSVWAAYTPFMMGILPDGDSHAFFQALHLVNVVRLPARLPGNGSLELVLELCGLFRFPMHDTDDDGNRITRFRGLAVFGLNPGLRYRLPRWDLSLGAKIGFGDWVALGDRYTVGLEVARRF